ncbi:MAG: WGR domain-containing protein [Saprospiraceae bacterium]|nr:WGR domain-containing protein [Saprospiraceae bacterium]
MRNYLIQNKIAVMRLFDFLTKLGRQATPAPEQGQERGSEETLQSLPEGTERQVLLQFQEGNSDKVYHLSLLREGDLYQVYFEYGRRGAQLQTGFKTPAPVSLEVAEKTFNALLNEKTKKGYQPYEGPESSHPTTRTRKKNPVTRKKAILTHLDLAVRNPGAQADKNWAINRVVWRAGVLRIPEALPHLAGLLNHPPIAENPALMRYCTLWAIARCAMTADEDQKSKVKPALNALAETECNPMLYQVSTFVFSASERLSMREKLLQKLPPSFQHQVRQEQGENLLLTLKDYVENRPKSHFSFVETLYALSGELTFLQPAIHWFAQHAPFRPGFFKVLRHLFKMAEMRLDAAMFGILVQRFALEPPMFSTSFQVLVNGVWQTINPATELVKEDSKLAFSSKTRQWLLRRSLQSLLDTLEYDDHTYVKMAAGLLLALDDDRCTSQLQGESRYVFNEKTKRWDINRTVFPPFSEFPVAFYVLNGANPNYRLLKRGTRWATSEEKYNKQSKSAAFEAHPERWDACPQAYIHLLAESRAEMVQAFALRRFKAHPDFNVLTARFDLPLLRKLLDSPHLSTALLALELTELRFNPLQPDCDLVLDMLDNRHPAVRRKGHEWLRANLPVFVKDTTFVFRLLTHAAPDIRKETQRSMPEILGLLDENHQQALIVRIVAWLLGLEPEKITPTTPEKQTATNAALASEMIASMLEWGNSLLAKLSITVLEQLLQHPLDPIALFGARLIAARPNDSEHLPGSLLQSLLNSKSEAIREYGIVLIGQTSAAELFLRKEILFKNLINKYSPVREIIREALLQAIGVDEAFAEQLLGVCLNLLMRKEPVAAIHDELLGFAMAHLEVHLPGIERKTIFRLLNSEQIAANTLAAHLVERFVGAQSLTVRNIIRFGDHEVAAVRLVCQRMFLENKERMRYEREDAVRLLESEWDDTRAFAFDYFRTHFGEREWTPELLISVCDSIRPDVQAFGRELIGRYLKDEDGPEFLLMLSQHPRPEVQGYAAQYLEKYAAGNPGYLEKLAAYCTTVLMQVNKSRKAKDLVFNFLEREALQSEKNAEAVAAILDGVSLTAVKDDKAQCIRLMRDVHEKYPNVVLPLAPLTKQ